MTNEEIQQLEDKKFLANSKDRARNTASLSKKLEELKPLPFPEIPAFPEKIIVELAGVQMVKGDKGDKGDNPTDEYLTELIKPLIPEVRDGRDYVLTPKDKKEIASKIKVPVVEKVIEKTEVIKEQPIVTNEIKEVAVAETAEQIAEKLSALKDAWLEVKAIKGFEEYMRGFGSDFLNQAKGFSPRALASLYDVNIKNIADQQSLIWSASQQKFVPGSATTSGGGFTKLLSTETPDGSNTVFTYSQKPLYIISGGAWYEENNGWTWNAGASQATLSVAPPSQLLQLLAFV